MHPYKSADISRKSIEESWSWSRSFWENLRRLKMALIFKSEGSATKGRYRAARQIKREVVICREVETVAKVGVVGRDVIFVPILAGNEKLLLSSQSLLKGGRLKKYTAQKNIAQATKTAFS